MTMTPGIALSHLRNTAVLRKQARHDLRRHYDDLKGNIFAASAAGASTRQIARAAGISHQRVSQILKEER